MSLLTQALWLVSFKQGVDLQVCQAVSQHTLLSVHFVTINVNFQLLHVTFFFLMYVRLGSCHIMPLFLQLGLCVFPLHKVVLLTFYWPGTRMVVRVSDSQLKGCGSTSNPNVHCQYTCLRKQNLYLLLNERI